MIWQDFETELKSFNMYDVLLYVDEIIFQHAKNKKIHEDRFSDFSFFIRQTKDALARSVTSLLLEKERELSAIEVLVPDIIYNTAWAVSEIIRKERAVKFNKGKTNE